MTSPLQTPDFFVLEAGEALDGLEALLRADRAPVPDELVRAARLLRGAAVMAGQQPIAGAAAALEGVGRCYREQPGLWGAALRDELVRAVEELRALLSRIRNWGEADTARALRLGRTLEFAAGRGDGAAAAPGGTGHGDGALAAGVRAFVAREGALIASALDRAAQALRVSATDREPLYTVIRRMQSLRGLAALSELAPLPDVLDGIEMAVGDLTRTYAPPHGVDQVIDAAARALTRLSRDVAESGRPAAESAETRHFTELLVRVFAVEHDVVPIESLYVDGDPEPFRQAPAAAGFQQVAALGPLELVSHGEHLARTADLLTRARSATERDLRLYQLLGTLRVLGSVGPDPVAGALGVFARAVREALGAGVAERAMAPLVTCLQDAGELLRSVADSDNRMLLSRRLLDVAHRLAQLGTADAGATDAGTANAAPGEAAAGTDTDTPRTVAARDDRELEVVPIEQLLFADEEPPVVPIERLAPDDIASGGAAPETEPSTVSPDADPSRAGAAPSTLERTFRTYDRLRRERPSELPSLAALLGNHPTSTPPAEPPSAAAPTMAAADSTTSPADTAIPIGELCYRGQAALERADQVRQQLAAALAADRALSTIRPLLDELLDLVPLARAER